MAERMTPTNLRPGQTVAGRYEIREVVGRGGMGCIYRVYDKVLQEEVALKTLLPDLVEDKMILDRFFNEARITRSLSHPNIVRVHDIGQDKGIIYISMELLKGRSLRQLLDRLRPGQRLPINGILRMFDAICAALDYAHNYTVHRDIKPENVMILPNGAVKIMDFGISKLKANPNLTSASVVMGTPHYMSPEQLRNTSAVDQRADIYSLGVMLYEMLTGDKPTGLAKPASSIRGEVPGSLDPIIEKCCQPDPNKRFQTVGELREALREIRVALEGGTDPNAEIVDVGTTHGIPVQKAVLGAAMILVVLGAVYGFLRAEAYRQAALAAPPPPTDSNPSAGGSPADPSAATLNVLAERIDALRQDALNAIESDPDHPRRDYYTELMDEGERLWAASRTQQAADPAFALALAWDAVACFLVPTNLTEDAVFVPPKPVDVRGRAAPFFLDARPVSQSAFDSFCTATEWLCPEPSYRDPVAPMDRVTFYDALAFLSEKSPPRHLPTRSEWERGFAYFTAAGLVWDVQSDPPQSEDAEATETRVMLRFPYPAFSEWTASAANRSVDDPVNLTFGDSLYVMTGTWSDDVFRPGDTTRQAFGRAAAGLGFRGVRRLPRTVAELDRWQS